MVESIVQQVARLEERLNSGFDLIESELKSGEQSSAVVAWEDFWLGLLAEYERLCGRMWGKL